MKTILSIILILVIQLFIFPQSIPNVYEQKDFEYSQYDSFDDGWELGYVSGYCYKDTCYFEPNIPKYNGNMRTLKFEDGYDLGFKKGKSDRRKLRFKIKYTNN